VEGQASLHIAAILAHRTRNHVGAEGVARCVGSVCEDIGVALTLIVGPRGVAALYKRSLFLTSHRYSVLSGMHEGVESTIDLLPLTAVLASLSEADANIVGAAVLQSYYELLGSLVGLSLTERLLSSLWDHSLSDPPALEPTA
jgi:5-enolpyruvylshikimate-3-phosphate synthase